MRSELTVFTLLLGFAASSSAYADTAESRCDIYKSGSDQAEKMIASTFSQRSGYITINRGDGVVHVDGFEYSSPQIKQAFKQVAAVELAHRSGISIASLG
jgi:hypothetical protein